MALSHPAMCCTDRLFQIINPAACAIACPQAPGDLELTPRAFGTGKRREARHSHSHHPAVRSLAHLRSRRNCLVSPLAAEIMRRPKSNPRELRIADARSVVIVRPYQEYREGQLPIILGPEKARAKLAASAPCKHRPSML